MGRRYLLLGGSSEVSLAFIKSNSWQEDDEIVAQCFKNKVQLDMLSKEVPAKIHIVSADFSDVESTDNFIAGLKDMSYVPTHILHAPAVPVENRRFTEIDWSLSEKQINVQCRSLYKVIQSVAKPMAKSGGGKVVIVLSSYCLNVPPKFLSDYIIAKYALMGLGKALAAEYSGKKILVNMVSPSLMETKFLSMLHESIPEGSAKANPMGINADPKDVAGIICYLFSNDNNFISGANIPVTGGEAY